MDKRLYKILALVICVSVMLCGLSGCKDGEITPSEAKSSVKDTVGTGIETIESNVDNVILAHPEGNEDIVFEIIKDTVSGNLTNTYEITLAEIDVEKGLESDLSNYGFEAQVYVNLYGNFDGYKDAEDKTAEVDRFNEINAVIICKDNDLSDIGYIVECLDNYFNNYKGLNGSVEVISGNDEVMSKAFEEYKGDRYLDEEFFNCLIDCSSKSLRIKGGYAG